MDNLTPQQRRLNMQRIRSKNTKPERIIFRLLRANKVYFAKHVNSLFGKPDIVFRRKKVAVFIDSEFWHYHPEKCVMPITNREYWKEKLKRNRSRDEIVNNQLRKDGWKVIRFWEYEVKNSPECVLNGILKSIDKT